MQTFKISHPHQLNQTQFNEMVVALGYFDGVHKGHQAVIETAREQAQEKELKWGVMTFHPHPSVVLRKQQVPEAITPLDDKVDMISSLGADYLFIIEFSEAFSALEPQEFIDQYIIGLNVKHVVAGFDFSYGKLGKGTMESLPFHSRGQFEQTTVPKLKDFDRKISSTLIREVIRNGNVEYASKLLGRAYSGKGTVIHGEKRGRTIGFPTANIELNEGYITPPTGVYAVAVKIKDRMYKGVCNIGYKPTFHQEKALKPSVEVHIFDFHHEIYGENTEIYWYKRIRSEQKFNSIDELISQIAKDKQAAEEYFHEHS
ncbi:bifunctional riboflavin kinase/FAD synthetase [Bacillus sp. FJAT-42376]|uniref:bifunctional riboflavin kinase/FAD synthetase n=1 Tax=Bacillus sp. FJAT-42376 TaxID=2014076 RepID=UPI000F4D89F7|nr:bifunctional riboflavin kinase/FAD synthetase [Bacillus sp. FJAT-42376]AZB44843.1 bifunctional riboflavin kinase/FAD synthetase [Bacillus sp. FJAT-42376]